MTVVKKFVVLIDFKHGDHHFKKGQTYSTADGPFLERLAEWVRAGKVRDDACVSQVNVVDKKEFEKMVEDRK